MGLNEVAAIFLLLLHLEGHLYLLTIIVEHDRVQILIDSILVVNVC